MATDRGAPTAPAYRWVIAAAAALIMGLAMGQLVNGLSVFVLPLEAQFGWPRGAIASINSFCVLGIGLGGLLMGPLADRYGVRPVALIGGATVGLTMLVAARAEALWQFQAIFFLAGALGGGAFAGPLIAITGNWFAIGSGLAIGIVAAGQAVGQGAIPYVTALLIEGFGWRGALAISGIASLATMVPLALLLRPPPAAGPVPAGTPSDEAAPLPLRLAVPWMSLAALLCCTLMSTPLMHLVAYVQGQGIAAEDAGAVLFVMLIAAVGGRLAFGRLADMIGPIRAYLAASAWQTALVFGFMAIDGLSIFYIYAPVYGFGYGGVMTGLLTTTRQVTPAARRATAMSIILAFAWLGHATGGFQGGALYDVTGGYAAGFGLAAFAGILNLIVVGTLMLRLNRPPPALA